MKYITVRNVTVPALGFGTWELMDENEATSSVRTALDVGYRHIDTAQIYQNEEFVGTALSQSPVPREEIFLTTKVWRSNVAAADVQSSVEESLRKLKTDYVDLLLIHWPVPDVPVKETLEAMQALKEQGKVRNLGLSNFTVPLMKEAIEGSGVDLLTNQVEYHPFLNQDHILEYLLSKNMFLTAYCPLVKGRAFDHPTLQKIAQAHGKSVPQVLLRWLVQQDNVAAIPRSSNPAHIKSNFEIFDFELDADAMQDIAGLARPDGRLISPEFAPDWKEAA